MLITIRALPLALCVLAPIALAQGNLGELVDAGAKRMSIEEFKQELVQRVIVGPTMSGGDLEIMYANNGEIQGRGIAVVSSAVTPTPIAGEWKIGDSGRICSSMRVGGTNPVVLPSRCQWWFKLGERYFLADSDTDRSTRVLVRTLKR